MDADRFDTLTRTLTAAGSRRRALVALAGSLSLIRLTDSEDAAAAKSGKCKPKCGECEKCDKGDCEKKNGKKRCKKGKCKAKDNGTPCTNGSCQSGSCAVLPPPPSPCTNGVKDGSETDIDCGGGTCPRCATGKTCASRNDCASAHCTGTKCAVCVNAGDCGNDADGVSSCACRDHESGQRFCTKNGPADVRLLPAGTPCTACQGGEQCFPINGGANGIECILPCGA